MPNPSQRGLFVTALTSQFVIHCVPDAWHACVHVVCVCVCVRVCVGVCATPNHFNKSMAFAIIHHLSTAWFALQQCLVAPPHVAFPSSQHDTKAIYRPSCAYHSVQPRITMLQPLCKGPDRAILRLHTSLCVCVRVPS